jgi:hypothetical protein
MQNTMYSEIFWWYFIDKRIHSRITSYHQKFRSSKYEPTTYCTHVRGSCLCTQYRGELTHPCSLKYYWKWIETPIMLLRSLLLLIIITKPWANISGVSIILAYCGYPMAFLLPKTLNYLAFKSLTMSVPDEGYVSIAPCALAIIKYLRFNFDVKLHLFCRSEISKTSCWIKYRAPNSNRYTQFEK